jgi:hypothetical protein
MLGKISGIYETTYGNVCQYIEGDETAYDIDMGEEIPLDMVDFEKFIRDLDEEYATSEFEEDDLFHDNDLLEDLFGEEE